MVQTETIAGVHCLHLELGRDVTSQLTYWRGVHLSLKGRMGVGGVCVAMPGPVGVQGVADVFSALGGLAAASLVLHDEDCLCGRQMAMAAAGRGEVRAIFDDLLPAVVWIAARAKAIQLARSLPSLEPELRVRKHARG